MSTTPPPALFLSIVAPCYNEEAGLSEFHRRVTEACERVVDGSYEIVLVNDGSRDGTWAVMQRLVEQDRRVVAMNLSRNYGHQLALTAGLQHCRGDHILIIDADLQDPPELLSRMLDRMAEEGADVVYGQRTRRKGETYFKSLTAALFYRILRQLIDIEIPLDTGDFRLMTRRALDVLNAMPEQYRFVRGMVSWIGMRQVPLLYDRDARFAGSTNYPFSKMLRFGVDAITGFSVSPLRLASCFGALLGVLSFLMLIYTFSSWAFGHVVEGWTSLTTIVLIIGSVQLLVLGVMGEYLGRLYMEAKRRPLFVVQDVLTADSALARRAPSADRIPAEASPRA